MARTREEILQERKRLREEYGDLFDATAALLFRHDPAGINFEVNPDEYQSEAGSILPRLRACQSAADLCRVVHEEFLGSAEPEPFQNAVDIAFCSSY